MQALTRFSIVTITSGEKDDLIKTCNSISCQEYPADLINWIIVASSFPAYTDPKFINNFTLIEGLDCSIYDAMNLGLAASRGKYDYLIFLNSGDIFANLDSLYNLSSYIVSKGDPDSILGASLINGRPSRPFARGDSIFAPSLLPFIGLSDWPIHQAFVVSKRAALGVWFNTSLRFGADLLFMEMCIKNSRTVTLYPRALTIYDRSGLSSVNKHATARRLEAAYLSIHLIFHFGFSYRSSKLLLKSILALALHALSTPLTIWR